MHLKDILTNSHFILLYFVCLLKQASLSVTAVTYRSGFFRDYVLEPFTDASPDVLIRTETYISIIQCCTMCYSDQRCQNIIYDKDSKTCIGYGFYVPVNSTTTLSSGKKLLPLIFKECSENGYLYNRHLNSCFKIVDIPLNWTNAKQACEDENSHLIYLKTVEKITFMITHLRKTYEFNYWYIGLSDVQQEGVFQWIDGTSFDTNISSDFDDGNSKEISNDYGLLSLRTDKIIDSPGYVLRRFVCEKAIN